MTCDLPVTSRATTVHVNFHHHACTRSSKTSFVKHILPVFTSPTSRRGDEASSGVVLLSERDSATGRGGGRDSGGEA